MIFTTGIITALINVSIGALVLINNPKKSTNMPFFLLTVVLSGYALAVFAGFSATTEAGFLMGIRTGCYVGALQPVALHLLCLAIANPEKPLTSLVVRTRWTFLFSQIAGFISISPYFLVSAIMPDAPEAKYVFPEGVLGPGYHAYNIYFPVAFTAIIVSFVKRMRSCSGLQRNEFHFVLLGMATFAFIAIFIAMVIPTATGKNQAQIYAPLAILPLDAIIAYGIATRRIMEVGYILRRIAAYSLLTVYLGTIYVAVYSLTAFAIPPHWNSVMSLPHILSALAVAFSMAPAHGILQRFANRLFVTANQLDVGAAVGEISHMITSIRTLSDLMEQFTKTVATSVGCDYVSVYLKKGQGYIQAYPEPTPNQEDAYLEPGHPLAAELEFYREPIVLDELSRLRPTPKVKALQKDMEELQAGIAVGIRSPETMEGFLLLGPKASGQIFSTTDIKTLPILCDQVAVALENAELYTQTIDSKIYNEVLLDNLTTGVIAANADGQVTVVNREAQRIIGMNRGQLIGHLIDELPDVLEKALQETLSSEAALRDLDTTLITEEEDIPIRIGSSIFRGHTGESLGALLVFGDLTQIKKLESQVRRHDRLASIGTLAAGMAHEIKNPLVTVKTFVQLLPEQYQDKEFRSTFADLIGSEVTRIDTIVNQLLNFARPVTPDLKPTHLHDVVGHCLRLSSQQMKQTSVEVFDHLGAEDDLINADSNLLQQAMLNFILNASDAMVTGGDLFVTTRSVNGTHQRGQRGRARDEDYIEITIRDTGEGISKENLGSIFDPFFTTKGSGTGLGLSVSHGIIEEHSGRIEVESSPGEGTTFVIAFPLITRKVAS